MEAFQSKLLTLQGINSSYNSIKFCIKKKKKKKITIYQNYPLALNEYRGCYGHS